MTKNLHSRHIRAKRETPRRIEYCLLLGSRLKMWLFTFYINCYLRTVIRSREALTFTYNNDKMKGIRKIYSVTTFSCNQKTGSLDTATIVFTFLGRNPTLCIADVCIFWHESSGYVPVIRTSTRIWCKCTWTAALQQLVAKSPTPLIPQCTLLKFQLINRTDIVQG